MPKDILSQSTYVLPQAGHCLPSLRFWDLLQQDYHGAGPSYSCIAGNVSRVNRQVALMIGILVLGKIEKDKLTSCGRKRE